MIFCFIRVFFCFRNIVRLRQLLFAAAATMLCVKQLVILLSHLLIFVFKRSTAFVRRDRVHKYAEVRLRKKLIIKEKVAVLNICVKCVFKSESYFYSQFKKYYMCSPKELVKNAKICQSADTIVRKYTKAGAEAPAFFVVLYKFVNRIEL